MHIGKLAIAGGLICSLIGIFFGVYSAVLKPALEAGEMNVSIKSIAIVVIVTVVLVGLCIYKILSSRKRGRDTIDSDWP